MASIERTAYPRFKRTPGVQELHDLYMPTAEEIMFADSVSRQHRFTLLVLLKSFQRLGYFPKLEEVPAEIVSHVRSCLRPSPEMSLGVGDPRTLYHHHRLIREYLGVVPYGKQALHISTLAVSRAAIVMDNPADLINVAIEDLAKERCELPAFSTLDRLVRRVRTLVNRRFFEAIFARLTDAKRETLDALLDVTNRRLSQLHSPFNTLKQLPKRATLRHLQDLLEHRAWLATLLETNPLLVDLPAVRVKHLAAEAKALDASEMRDFAAPKRSPYSYALSIVLACRRLTTWWRCSLSVLQAFITKGARS